MTEPNASASNQTQESAKPALVDGDKGVVLQRDNATYAIAPHIPCGLVTPELLRRIADVAERYGCQALKLTSAERIALIGLSEADVDAAWRDLGVQPGSLVGERVRSVRVCPGTTFCKRGQQDSIKIGKILDAKYHGEPTPGKLKISVSGCPNQCTEPTTKDIGIVGSKPGWSLIVGGSGGSTPRLGTCIARRCTDDEILTLVEGVLAFYRANAKPRERLHRTLARVGLDALTDALGLPRVPSAGSSEPEG